MATAQLQEPDRREHRIGRCQATGPFACATVWSRYKSNFELIFLDCPPALDLLTLNVLCAAGTLIVPMQAEYFALEGISGFLIRPLNAYAPPTIPIS